MRYIKNSLGRLMLATLLVFSVSSCNKFLDEQNPSNFTMENYFTKPEHAQSAVNAIYQSLLSIPTGEYGGAPWMMLEFPTGLANTEYGQSVDNLNIRNLVNTAENNHGIQKWTSSYRGIGNANLAIAKIPDINMDEKAKNRYLGEAHFLRAYFYFDLVRIFGQIPLIKDVVTSTSPEIYSQQASIEDVYKLIVEDLTAAEGLGLPWTDVSGHATMGAVKSLLSSVYLTMAGFPLQKGNEYFQKAADKANEVISSNQFSLFTSYDDLHSLDKENMGEQIFMVQFAAGTWTTSMDFQKFILPYTKNISLLNNRTGAIYASNEFVATYEAGDKRAQDRQFFFSTYTLTTDRNTTIPLGGFYLYKFFDVQANTVTGTSGLNFPLIRYPEVLLIYAEASNEISGPTAASYEAVNKIRRRANLANLSGLSQQAFRQAIWKERYHELCYENKIWFDMVRLRQVLNVQTNNFESFVGHKFTYGPTLSARELLFPFPTVEINNNKNITQNQGY